MPRKTKQTMHLSSKKTKTLRIVIPMIIILALAIFGFLIISSSTGCYGSNGFSCYSAILSTTGTINVSFSESVGSLTLIGISCTNSSMQSSNYVVTPLLENMHLKVNTTYSLTFQCPYTSTLNSSIFHGYLWALYSSNSSAQKLISFAQVSEKATTKNTTVVYTGVSSSFKTSIDSSEFAYPVSVAFAPSGAYAYVINQGGQSSNNINITGNILIINTSLGIITGSINSNDFDFPSSVAFSPSGTYAYITNKNAGNILIINTSTSQISGSISIFNLISPSSLAVYNHGSSLYVLNTQPMFGIIKNNSMGIYSINLLTNTSSLITNSNPFFDPSSLALSGSFNNNESLYITNTYGGANRTGNIFLLNLSNDVLTSINNTEILFPFDIAVSPSGNYAYIVNNGGGLSGAGNILILNTKTNQLQGSLDSISFNNTYSIAFSPSGSYAYLINARGGLKANGNIIIINNTG